MFDAEKILGGLISSGLGRNVGSKAGLGLGLLGLALAAGEHFLGGRSAAPGQAVPPPPGRPAGATPPPPPGRTPPPPPPPSPAAGRTAPPPPPPASGAARQAEACLLIRAMIAAAAADGAIDAAERSNILSSLEAAGLSREERDFVTRELHSPAEAAAIAREVTRPEQAEKVYAASLLAVAVDTPAELAYLAELARLLGLSEATVERLTRTVGA
jgi:hypothetical protein